jgi:Ca2+-binding RTX toxin-like protein
MGISLFNTVVGSTTHTGTDTQDFFFLFTFNNNLNNLRADANYASLNWTTAIKGSPTSLFNFSLVNINVNMDLAIGGLGADRIYGSNFNDAIFYNNGTILNGFGGFTSVEQFFMEGGNDFVDLTGQGPGGVDFAQDAFVSGGTGNDTVIGGAGKDQIEGNDGDDVLFGYRGADTINGGAGNDTIYGDDLGFNNIAGNDILFGNDGNDIIYGGARPDQIDGGNDNDTLYGGFGGDGLKGGAGDDTIYGDDVGQSGGDIIEGGGGNDLIFGVGGNDEMYGNAGDDTMEGGEGTDYINGGTEIDTAVFSGNRTDYSITLNANGSFTIVDLRAGSPDGTDTVLNIEFYQFADGTVPAGSLNSPPVITSNGGGASADVTIAENTQGVANVTATDPDVGQTVTFSIQSGADGAFFAIDAQTGVLTFVNPPDFENPLDSNGDNIYSVVVRASDGNGGVDTQTISVTITDVLDGAPPVITSNGGGASTSITIDENATAVTDVDATDVDSPVITYRISGGADAAKFGIDQATGVLFFLNAPDHETPTDAGANNIYNVVVEAFDGQNADSQAIAVTVANLNDNAPSITSNGGGATASITIAENVAVATTVLATDADGTAPVYSISGGVDAALFQIDAATGVLTFVAVPDFENPADAGADNIYDVTIMASDGANSDTQQLQIAVTNANDNAPVISSNGGGTTANIAIAENTATVTTVVAADADGTQPSYRISGGADASRFAIDAVTGVLVFLNAPDFENPIDANADNVYDVIVEAFDGTNVDSQALLITVTNVNENGVTITGSSNNNTITPTASNIALRTTALNDTVFGLGGNDIIDGGLGADYMDGGTGNDTFFVDTYSEDGFAGNDDQVIELAGGGTDIVNASVSYRLASEVENLTLIGVAAINGTGNTLANTINGNAAANTIDGGDGSDSLNGQGGADTMIGGLGNDIFFVDTYSIDGNATNDDTVVEVAGGGTDTVNSSVTYAITSDIEILNLTGAAAINATGNDIINTINGNSANNVISGGLGNDVLSGGNGADTLNGDDGNDRLLGGSQDDILNGGAGIDRLEGGDNNDTLIGGTGGDTLLGMAGIDVLNGGQSKDTMTGGSEADTFVFAAGDSALNGANSDIITDFVSAQDVIDLTFVTSPLGAAAYAETQIATAVFTDAQTAANALNAPGRVAVFVAGTAGSWLFLDSDGNGSYDQTVVFSNLNSIAGFSATDII